MGQLKQQGVRNACQAIPVACVLVLCLLACVFIPVERAHASLNGEPVVVSMGDSFSSGEGVEPFYGQEDVFGKFGNEDWLAHRSKKAWSGLLQIDGVQVSSLKEKGNWRFVAASGAESQHILGDGSDHVGDDYGVQLKHWGATDDFLSNEHALPCQMKALTEGGLPEDSIDYVTLTIGGNDLGFVDVVGEGAKDSIKEDVVAASELVHVVDKWSMWGYVKDIPGLRTGTLQGSLDKAVETFKTKTLSRLVMLYGEVLKNAGSNATLVVAGYPHLFPQTGRLPFINANAAKLINSAVDTFDTEVKRAIGNRGEPRIVFADPRDYFNGREQHFINNIMVGPRLEDLVLFTPVSAYSVHPNEHGHKAYARAVQDKIKEVEEGRVGGTTSTSSSAAKDVDVDSNVAMSLVFDVSGSMNESSALSGKSKLESAKKQSSDFVSSIGGEKDAVGGLSVRVGVCSFSNNAQTNCGLSNNPDEINASINALKAGGQTNMYAGLGQGINQLTSENGPRLMVFLSDGLSNMGGSKSDILALARQAAEEDIRIYTIGFGPSSSLDEDLLKEIASITNGSYSHEDSSNISSAAVGLFATMMNARLEAVSKILHSFIGAVKQGGTDDAGTFDITQNGKVQIYLYWPGSVLDMQLTDPSGTKVTEGYAGYTIDTSSIPTSITIENAKQGTWSMEVYGREVSMDDEPYYAVAAFNETQAPAATGGGGGSATNNGEGLIFLLVVVVIASIGGVFALSKRRSSDEM